MLTAIGSDGVLFNLADHKGGVNELRKLRSKFEYSCPVCGLKMIMKLGEKRIWHFAHEGSASCNERWEPESNYHLTGKQQLYEWLKKEHPDVKVECYLHASRQRPDLLLPTSKIAIEYQCSLINNSILLQRTNDYHRLGFDVYWILGAKRLKISYHQIQSIREMEWAATSIRQGLPTLLYYCPKEMKFALVTLHYSLTSTKFICTTAYYSSSSTSFTELLRVPSAPPNPYSHHQIWFKQKQIWRNNPHGEKSFAYFFLRKLFYSHGRSIRMFPSEAGIPSSENYWIETPPYLWQSWILVCFLGNISTGSSFTFNMLFTSFRQVIAINMIKIRRDGTVTNKGIVSALKGYLRQLIRLKVLQEWDNERYEKLYQPQLNSEVKQCLKRDEEVSRRLR